MRPARYWGYPESCSAEDILTPGERTMKDPDWQTSHNSLTIPSQDQILPISTSTFNSEDNQSLKSIKYLLKIVDCFSRTNFSTNEVREGREEENVPIWRQYWLIITDYTQVLSWCWQGKTSLSKDYVLIRRQDYICQSLCWMFWWKCPAEYK